MADSIKLVLRSSCDDEDAIACLSNGSWYVFRGLYVNLYGGMLASMPTVLPRCRGVGNLDVRITCAP